MTVEDVYQQEHFRAQIKAAVTDQLYRALDLLNHLTESKEMHDLAHTPVMDASILTQDMPKLCESAGELVPGAGKAIMGLVGGVFSIGKLLQMYQGLGDRQSKIEWIQSVIFASRIKEEIDDVILNAGKVNKTKRNTLVREKIASIATSVADHLTHRFQFTLNGLDHAKNQVENGGDLFTQQIIQNIREQFGTYVAGCLEERLIQSAMFTLKNNQQHPIKALKEIPLYFKGREAAGNMFSACYRAPVIETSLGHEAMIVGHNTWSSRSDTQFPFYQYKPDCLPGKYPPLVMREKEVLQSAWAYVPLEPDKAAIVRQSLGANRHSFFAVNTKQGVQVGANLPPLPSA